VRQHEWAGRGQQHGSVVGQALERWSGGGRGACSLYHTAGLELGFHRVRCIRTLEDGVPDGVRWRDAVHCHAIIPYSVPAAAAAARTRKILSKRWSKRRATTHGLLLVPRASPAPFSFKKTPFPSSDPRQRVLFVRLCSVRCARVLAFAFSPSPASLLTALIVRPCVPTSHMSPSPSFKASSVRLVVVGCRLLFGVVCCECVVCVCRV
jgi:hypothetical protein